MFVENKSKLNDSMWKCSVQCSGIIQLWRGELIVSRQVSSRTTFPFFHLLDIVYAMPRDSRLFPRVLYPVTEATKEIFLLFWRTFNIYKGNKMLLVRKYVHPLDNLLYILYLLLLLVLKSDIGMTINHF